MGGLESQIGVASGPTTQVTRETVGRSHLAAAPVEEPQPEQRREPPRRVADLLAELPCPRVGGFDRRSPEPRGGHRRRTEPDLEVQLARGARGIVRLPRQQLERVLVVPPRLTECAPSPRGVAGSLEVVDGPAVVAAELEVEGELRGDLAGSRSPGPLLDRSDPAMEGGATTPRDPSVERVAEQRVDELELQVTAGRRLGPRPRIRTNRRLAGCRNVVSAPSSSSSAASATTARSKVSPTTLAASRTRRSIGESRAICRSMTGRMLSGIPRSASSTSSLVSHPSGSLRHHLPLDELIEHGRHEQRIAPGVVVHTLRQPLEGRSVGRAPAEVSEGRTPRRPPSPAR